MEYVDIGEEVSVETAVCQTAHALDLASRIATDTRNADALLDAARLWQNLAGFISDLSEKMEEDKDSVPMGFQGSKRKDSEDEDARDNKG